MQEIYTAVLNDRIHLAGGFRRIGPIVGPTSNHSAYDPAQDTWQQLADLPDKRHHPQIVSHGGKLYALGGYEVSSFTAVWVMKDQSWVYDPSADSWDEVAAAPEPHAETVAADLAGRIHIVGGRGPMGASNRDYEDHGDTDRHLIFDPTANRWERAAPALSKRNSAAGAVIDGLFYIAGGRTVTGGNVTTLEIYDPKEDKWRSGAPMPQAQAGLAAAALNGKLYAFGGEHFNNGGGVFAECWVYDPAQDQWQASTPMATPRHGLGGAAVNGWIYSVGGAVEPRGDGTSDILERFKPA